jgi:hypothetical protein
VPQGTLTGGLVPSAGALASPRSPRDGGNGNGGNGKSTNNNGGSNAPTYAGIQYANGIHSMTRVVGLTPVEVLEQLNKRNRQHYELQMVLIDNRKMEDFENSRLPHAVQCESVREMCA